MGERRRSCQEEELKNWLIILDQKYKKYRNQKYKNLKNEKFTYRNRNKLLQKVNKPIPSHDVTFFKKFVYETRNKWDQKLQK